MVYNAIIDNNHIDVIKYITNDNIDVIKYITNDNIDDCFLFAYHRRNFQMMHYILTLYKHRKLNPAKITLNDICVRRYSKLSAKTVFEYSRTRREPVYLKTV